MSRIEITADRPLTVEQAREWLQEGAYYLYGTRPDRVCKLDLLDGTYQVTFPATRFKEDNVMCFPSLPAAVGVINAWLINAPVEVGDVHREHINHGWRECEVLKTGKIRYRILFEMPNCTQEGWRRGILVCGELFYPFSPWLKGVAA